MLLPFHASWVRPEQLEVLQWAPRPRIVGLEGASQRGHTSFTLASRATATDANIYIKHACVRADRERLENAVPLRRLVEVLNEGLSINGDFTRSCSHADHGSACLALAVAPSLTLAVKFGLTKLLRHHPPKVEQVDPVELGEVV